MRFNQEEDLRKFLEDLGDLYPQYCAGLWGQGPVRSTEELAVAPDAEFQRCGVQNGIHIARIKAAASEAAAAAAVPSVPVHVNTPKEEFDLRLPVDSATGRVNLTLGLASNLGTHVLDVQGIDVAHPEDPATYKPQFKRSRIKLNLTPTVQAGDIIFIKAKRS